MPKASISLEIAEAESSQSHRGSTHVATAQSTTGLRNSEPGSQREWHPENSVPIPGHALTIRREKNTLKVSSYMDELGVEPSTFVSYFIRAQRITDQKVPDTTSAISLSRCVPFATTSSK